MAESDKREARRRRLRLYQGAAQAEDPSVEAEAASGEAEEAGQEES
jgi:hypothetical protein